MSKETIAIEICEHLVRAWQVDDCDSACDLLDHLAELARDFGIVTPAHIAKWEAEDEAEIAAALGEGFIEAGDQYENMMHAKGLSF